MALSNGGEARAVEPLMASGRPAVAQQEVTAVMTFLSETIETVDANPLDEVEHFVAQQEWSFDRQGEGELAVAIAGRWCDYHIWFCWQPGNQSLHVSCAFDAKIPSDRQLDTYRLIGLMNEKMSIGNFDLVSRENLILYRHAMLLRGSNGVSNSQVEDMVENALQECERFYPALQFVLWGGSSAETAITAAMMEPVGEA
jgi:hypothetical protein